MLVSIDKQENLGSLAVVQVKFAASEMKLLSINSVYCGAMYANKADHGYIR